MSIVDAAVGRAWRALADTRRRLTRAGSARSALRSLGSPSRRDLDRWHRATSEMHERYRAEHRPASRRVTVMCVSMRPHLLDSVIDGIAAQAPGLDLDVVFVANHPDFAGADLERRLAPLGRFTVVNAPDGTSLGSGLNLALDATSARFVAKFDDDDWYGPGYLLDALRAHGYAGAGVVGKHTYYADVMSTGDRFIRFPGHEFSYSGTLAGGTLVIDRERVGDLRFEDVSLGEDRAFIAACHRRGISTFSADRFGFVQHRGDDNTWAIGVDEFLAGCVPVDRRDPDHWVDRPDDGRGVVT